MFANLVFFPRFGRFAQSPTSAGKRGIEIYQNQSTLSFPVNDVAQCLLSVMQIVLRIRTRFLSLGPSNVCNHIIILSLFQSPFHLALCTIGVAANVVDPSR
jgi:hypothetical protein